MADEHPEAGGPALTCPSCGQPAVVNAAFCGSCGAALHPAPPPAAPLPPPPYQATYQAPYQAPYQPTYPVVAPRATNGMAIAAMVLGILWLYWVGSILALIFGYIALNQIKQRHESGRGMAIAGVVLGWIGVGTLVIVIIAAIAAPNHSPYG